MDNPTPSPCSCLRCIYARLSDQAYKKAEWRLKSFSGADQSESEIYLTESRVYQDLCRGVTIEKALKTHESYFKRSVEQNNKRINEAPKISSGPREGQSVIEHRWLDIDAFKRRIPQIRQDISNAILKKLSEVERKSEDSSSKVDDL